MRRNNLKFNPSNQWFRKAKLLLTVLICLSSSETTLATTFKIATAAPDGLSFMKKVRAATKLIESETEGRVKFKIYPGNVQGDDQTVLRKIKIGQLHGGVIAAGSLTKFYPDLQVYNLPLSFQNFAEVDYARQYLDPVIIKGLRSAGIVSFGLTETGFAYMLSNTPITSVADAIRTKAWVPDNDPTALKLLRSFGISPIPLKFADVLPGLQTGLINALASPPVVVVAMQWHTRVKYITELPIAYMYGVMMLDLKAFNRISSADQQVVQDILKRVFAEIARQNRMDYESAYNVLLNQKIKAVKPSAAELLEWQSKSADSIAKLVRSGELSSEILELLQKHLSEFRKNAGGISTNMSVGISTTKSATR